jgi:hypothetical protein
MQSQRSGGNMSDHNKRYLRQTLTVTELDVCMYIGKLRHSITSKQGTERKQDASMNSLQMSINGVITEYAVAKTLNLNFDLRKFGADLTLQDGRTIDVKSTNTAGGNLNAVGWSVEKPCDVFVLTEIHPTHVRIVGWIGRAKFLRPENLRDVGNGEFYSVPQTLLNAFDEKYYKESL